MKDAGNCPAKATSGTPGYSKTGKRAQCKMMIPGITESQTCEAGNPDAQFEDIVPGVQYQRFLCLFIKSNETARVNKTPISPAPPILPITSIFNVCTTYWI